MVRKMVLQANIFQKKRAEYSAKIDLQGEIVGSPPTERSPQKANPRKGLPDHPLERNFWKVFNPLDIYCNMQFGSFKNAFL